MSKNVRNPQQERSIEKKNKIVRAGYELFSEVGYYNTNTAEIAKRAEVSTGIVYGYFRNKKDILTEVLAIYLDDICRPIFALFEKIDANIGLKEIISEIVQSVIVAHKEHAKIHEALHSLTHTDREVSEAFINLENDVSVRLEKLLAESEIKVSAPREKIHLAMNIIQSYAHEYVYDRHEYLDYDKMRAIVEESILKLFVE